MTLEDVKRWYVNKVLEEAGGNKVRQEIKLAQAERCPKALGTLIKASEVQYHHEVTNQHIWKTF